MVLPRGELPRAQLPRESAAPLTGVFELDLRTSAMRWSKGMFLLLGLDIGTVKPSIEIIKNMMCADDSLFSEVIDENIADGTGFTKDCIMTDHNNGQIDVRLHCEFVRDVNGQPTALVGACWQTTA